MMSASPCIETGQAEIDPFTLTVNTVFMQFIEQADIGGFFGNMIDVLLQLALQPAHDTSDLHTVTSLPIPALMVPPEHRKGILPIANDLQRILAAGAPPKTA